MNSWANEPPSLPVSSLVLTLDRSPRSRYLQLSRRILCRFLCGLRHLVLDIVLLRLRLEISLGISGQAHRSLTGLFPHTLCYGLNIFLSTVNPLCIVVVPVLVACQYPTFSNVSVIPKIVEVVAICSVHALFALVTEFDLLQGR